MLAGAALGLIAIRSVGSGYDGGPPEYVVVMAVVGAGVGALLGHIISDTS